MKTNIKRIGVMSAGVMTAGLISMTGVASASTGSWSDRGDWRFESSHNQRFNRPSRNSEVRNNNDVRITNTTDQRATSGDVRVEDNDDVWGKITSGDATNVNKAEFNVDIRNDVRN